MKQLPMFILKILIILQIQIDIFREQYLLNQSRVSTTRELQFVATIMAHENTHMWFGNEVSPELWDYLWLSEGFATYFEHYSTDLVKFNICTIKYLE